MLVVSYEVSGRQVGRKGGGVPSSGHWRASDGLWGSGRWWTWAWTWTWTYAGYDGAHFEKVVVSSTKSRYCSRKVCLRVDLRKIIS